MSGVEWSLYFGLTPTVTLHRIDNGIDTGDIYAMRSIEVQGDDKISTLRARTVLTGIDLLVDHIEEIIGGTQKAHKNNKEQGRQYFEMTRPIRALVDHWLSKGITPNVDPTQANMDPRVFTDTAWESTVPWHRDV